MENGIYWYDKAVAHVPVFFPEGKRTCQYCKLFCRYEEPFKRYSCRITNEWLMNPMHEIGTECPLVFEKGE